jgi:SAM-dependent methyltransferase
MDRSALHGWWVRHVWARHNLSVPVQRAMKRVLNELDVSTAFGLNVGCGYTDLHPRMLRFDLDPGVSPDSIGSVDKLPFLTDTFAVVVSQEVLEHVRDPRQALAELVRVLKPGGLVYLQTPFIIGYHAVPADYWRFTNEGLSELLEREGLTLESLEPAVGAGTGLYRIIVEFCAVVAARIAGSLFLPVKAVATIVFAPLRWSDNWLSVGEQRWRIPGGCLALARKTS